MMQSCCASFGIWKAILALVLTCMIFLIFLHEPHTMASVYVYLRPHTITCTNCHGTVHQRVLQILAIFSSQQLLQVILASKVMLKILQARLQQYVNGELPYVQAGFGKGRGTRDQIANIAGSSKKQESSRKTSISALLTMPKPLTVWITIKCGKFWKRWEY